jgi:hypothetical protein
MWAINRMANISNLKKKLEKNSIPEKIRKNMNILVTWLICHMANWQRGKNPRV